MKDDRDKTSRRKKMNLPLSDDDFALAYGESGADDLEYEEPFHPVSYIKLFFAIVFAAPVATFLALAVIDLYSGFAVSAGLRKPQPLPAPVVKKEPSGESEKLLKLVEAFDKSNKKLLAAIGKQTEAIIKLAEKKPVTIKVESPKGSGQVKAQPPKIVVVKVPSREKFDLNYEKQKVLELAGIDLDDPVTNSKPFNSIKSRDVLKELIRSFDLIIAAARDHDEVSDFLKSNAMTAKKYATRRLKKVR